MNTKIIVSFRGRNTRNIMAQCRFSQGLSSDTAECIICRENDFLAENGDMPLKRAQEFLLRLLELNKEVEVLLVANGGTTAQQVPFVHWLATGWEGSYSIVEMDGSTVILHAQGWAGPKTSCPHYDCPVCEAHDERRHGPMPWLNREVKQ